MFRNVYLFDKRGGRGRSIADPSRRARSLPRLVGAITIGKSPVRGEARDSRTIAVVVTGHAHADVIQQVDRAATH